ncbi:hypothetical protein Emag_002240 [Eimeria magna]
MLLMWLLLGLASAAAASDAAAAGFVVVIVAAAAAAISAAAASAAAALVVLLLGAVVWCGGCCCLDSVQQQQEPLLLLLLLLVPSSAGWSSVFATHACSSGRYYFEAEVLHPEPEDLRFEGLPLDCQPKLNPYFRLGVLCTSLIEWPSLFWLKDIAFQGFDFEAGFVGTQEPGDVIGCYICLPEPVCWPADPREDSKLYEYLQVGILCRPDNPPAARRSDPRESWVDFSVNGKR